MPTLVDAIRDDFLRELIWNADLNAAPLIADVLRRNFRIGDNVTVLGRGAFGLALIVDEPLRVPDRPTFPTVVGPGEVVIKLTSDAEEIQAAANLVGQELVHVIKFYGSYILPNFPVKNARTYEDLRMKFHEAKADAIATYPIGVTLGERLPQGAVLPKMAPGTPPPEGFVKYAEAVMDTKDKFKVWPDQLMALGKPTQRTRLERAQKYLIQQLLYVGGQQDPALGYVVPPKKVFPPAAEIALGLIELKERGIYGVDVHGKNVGRDAMGTYKIFDIGVSSSPRKVRPGFLINPGVAVTTVNNPEYIGWPAGPISDPIGRVLELY